MGSIVSNHISNGNSFVIVNAAGRECGAYILIGWGIDGGPGEYYQCIPLDLPGTAVGKRRGYLKPAGLRGDITDFQYQPTELIEELEFEDVRSCKGWGDLQLQIGEFVTWDIVNDMTGVIEFGGLVYKLNDNFYWNIPGRCQCNMDGEEAHITMYYVVRLLSKPIHAIIN